MFNSKLAGAIRNSKYRTQYSFAETVGAQSSIVSLVVNGKYNLTDAQKSRWAKALGATAEELFGEAETVIA